MFSTEPSCRSGHNVWRDVPEDLWGMLDKFYPTHGCEKLTEMKIPTSIFEDEHPIIQKPVLPQDKNPDSR